jgi:drug/metabolite transporter (DMT)-like permease
MNEERNDTSGLLSLIGLVLLILGIFNLMYSAMLKRTTNLGTLTLGAIVTFGTMISGMLLLWDRVIDPMKAGPRWPALDALFTIGVIVYILMLCFMGRGRQEAHEED